MFPLSTNKCRASMNNFNLFTFFGAVQLDVTFALKDWDSCRIRNRRAKIYRLSSMPVHPGIVEFRERSGATTRRMIRER